MKIFKLSSFFILLSLIFLLGLKKYRNFNISRDLKEEKKDKLIKSAEILNNCFDLKNKSKRSLNDSRHLINYCLNEYGSEK